MSKPAANHRHVYACSYQMNSRRVTKRVRGDSLVSQGVDFLCSCRYISLQLEADASRSEWMAITIFENRFIVATRLSFQKSLEQLGSFRPERADSLFAAFTQQSNLER